MAHEEPAPGEGEGAPNILWPGAIMERAAAALKEIQRHVAAGQISSHQARLTPLARHALAQYLGEDDRPLRVTSDHKRTGPVRPSVEKQLERSLHISIGDEERLNELVVSLGRVRVWILARLRQHPRLPVHRSPDVAVAKGAAVVLE